MSPSATDEAFLARLADYLSEWGEFATEQDDFNATSDPFLLLDTEHTDDTSNISENAAISTKSTELNVDQRQADKKAQTTKRKLKYANKVKKEKKFLQEQVRHLSAELNELQKSKKKFKVLDEKFAELPVWMAVTLR
ncbi:hypothetical protein DVH05_025307 [Phytophthora capsici]|nr:hypothetical protein DVH05_025307 [Phytophthora capsici]